MTAVADNRVSASERTATTVQVCRNASMFPAASLMDFHVCAPFQLRRVSYSTASSRLSNFASLPDPTNSLARSSCAIMRSLAILMFDKALVSRARPPGACAHVHVHTRMRPSSDARLTGQPEAWVVKAGVHGRCMAADRGNAEYALYGELFQPGFPSVRGRYDTCYSTRSPDTGQTAPAMICCAVC